MSLERRVARLEYRMRLTLLTTLFTVGCGATVIDTTFQLDPAIASLSPARGPSRGGTSLLIRGSGWCGQPEVMVGGTPARAVERISDSLLGVETPAHAIGRASVEVRCNGLLVGAALEFAYHATDIELETSFVLPPDPERSDCPSFADVDGDGRDDVIRLGYDSRDEVQVCFNRSLFGFDAEPNLVIPFEGVPRVPYFAIADLDGDGATDLATFTGDQDFVTIHGYHSDGAAIGSLDLVLPRLQSIRIVDLDADGASTSSRSRMGRCASTSAAAHFRSRIPGIWPTSGALRSRSEARTSRSSPPPST